MKNKYQEMYRVQSVDEERSIFTAKNMPVRRVLISGCGKIEFNPDDMKYIYFSRTNKHHVYYIFNKVYRIIVDELRKNENHAMYKKLEIPCDLHMVDFYKTPSVNVLKRVQLFFRDYLPPVSVELVSLRYLNGFCDFLNDSLVYNKNKKDNFAPEISDRRMFGGAYGINDAWLSLFKCCVFETKHSNLTIDNFFEFLLYNSHRAHVIKQGLKSCLNNNPHFFEILDYITYTTLKNPDFYDKNNINIVKKSIREIRDERLYDQRKIITPEEFNSYYKQIHDEIIETREK